MPAERVVMRLVREVLTLRLSQKDPELMADLYDAYGRIVYSAILRMVGDPAKAEDLTQETFLRVWNGAHQYNGQRGPLGCWILTIARNRTIDYLRSNERRLAAASVDLNRLESGALPNPACDHRALAIDRRRSLECALKMLPTKQRAVVELAYFQGFSQAEISAHLNQPLGTVKAWARTALRDLRCELQRIETSGGNPRVFPTASGQLTAGR